MASRPAAATSDHSKFIVDVRYNAIYAIHPCMPIPSYRWRQMRTILGDSTRLIIGGAQGEWNKEISTK